MRSKSSNSRRALVLALALLVGIPFLAAAAPKPPRGPADLCLVTEPGEAFNALVVQDVTTALSPGRSMALHGFYFTYALKGVPFEGSAAMSADGTIRIGLFVHSSAGFDPGSTQPFRNDFTLSGVTDASFAGTLTFDSDGDFLANGILPMVATDCATLTIP